MYHPGLTAGYHDVRDTVRRAIPHRSEVRVQAGRQPNAGDQGIRVGIGWDLRDVGVPRIIIGKRAPAAEAGASAELDRIRCPGLRHEGEQQTRLARGGRFDRGSRPRDQGRSKARHPAEAERGQLEEAATVDSKRWHCLNRNQWLVVKDQVLAKGCPFTVPATWTVYV